MGREESGGRDFRILCWITFLTLCNTAIFHNFFPYLLHIGFSAKQAGLLIGLYPLASMFMYGFFSRSIGPGRARFFMAVGLVITGCCQVSYHFASSFYMLAVIRVCSGAGLFLTMASCMNLLVLSIPPGKTGSAFSLYSVAMLLPYSLMPAFSELVSSYITDTTILYMLVSLVLLPALWMVRFRLSATIGREFVEQNPTATGSTFTHRKGSKNILRIPVLTILLLNGVYFFLFSSLFYLLRGYGLSLGVANPGYFFTAQMGVMVVLRLAGGRLFDTFSKELTSMLAFFVTGLGYLLLSNANGTIIFFSSSLLFGLGMGLCVPPLNALMYQHAEPRFRGYNANMMLLAMHFGSFCGPTVGAVLASAGGFSLYSVGAGLLIGVALFLLLLLKIRHPVTSC